MKNMQNNVQFLICKIPVNLKKKAPSTLGEEEIDTFKENQGWFGSFKKRPGGEAS